MACYGIGFLCEKACTTVFAWLTVQGRHTIFSVLPGFPIYHLGGVVNNRTNKNESILLTDPWWLHNGGSAMQAFPEAPGALFSFRFPDLIGGKSGNREKQKKNCENTR